MREALARAFLWIAKWLHQEDELEEEEPEQRDFPWNPYDMTSPEVPELPPTPKPLVKDGMYGTYL